LPSAVRDGRWSGSHAGGGTIEFEVVNRGREAYLFGFAPPPLFRCSDGSSYRYLDYNRGSELAWIGRAGGFALRDAQDDLLFTVSGRLDGNAGGGSFRIIESHPDARGVCDTGTVGFSARRLGGARSASCDQAEIGPGGAQRRRDGLRRANSASRTSARAAPAGHLG
jgi:hypothetical protein